VSIYGRATHQVRAQRLFARRGAYGCEDIVDLGDWGMHVHDGVFHFQLHRSLLVHVWCDVFRWLFLAWRPIRCVHSVCLDDVVHMVAKK
jgi:hypothetical protein